MKSILYHDYEVFEDGRILTHKKCRGKTNFFLKQHLDGHGYYIVQLHINNKQITHKIHKLIAKLFIGEKPHVDSEICHIDGNKQNNHRTNLRWGTYEDNFKDKLLHNQIKKGNELPQTKLKENEVLKIQEMYDCDNISQYELSKMFNVKRSTIQHIVNRKTWKHI